MHDCRSGWDLISRWLVKQKLGQAIGGKVIDEATENMSAHVWALNGQLLPGQFMIRRRVGAETGMPYRKLMASARKLILFTSAARCP